MMGTGTFALPTFQALLKSSHQIVGLFTQPDRTGRGHHHHPHPMKEHAVEHGVPVFQPDNINLSESLESLTDLNADIAVVAAYGQILSAKLLSIPRLGAVNLHASLLPRHRGAAPIQYAIWSGDTETGVCIFQIEPKLDAGRILATVRTPIEPTETSGELHERLAALAVPLALQTLAEIEAGHVQGQLQDPALVTRAPRLTKLDGLIEWSQSARQIECQIRAMQPWPKASTSLSHAGENTRLILLKASVLEQPDGTPPQAAGTVVAVDSAECLVQTGEGLLSIEQLQAPGKRPMSIRDFLCGHAVQVGDRMDAGPADPS